MKKYMLFASLGAVFLLPNTQVSAQQLCTEMHHNTVFPDGAVGLAGDMSKFWANGQTITVKFIGGSDYVRQKVKQYAVTWSDYANVYFKFVEDNATATIRVSFEPGGSWSYVGTDIEKIAADKPTMNFGWFDDETEDEEFSRTVIHEFGHSLGLIHEHLQPASAIPWDKEKVYAYYAKQKWSKADVDRNIFYRYDHTTTQYSEYDKYSIMHYTIPNELTIGNFEVHTNRVLSATDKSFIAKIYPKTNTPSNKIEPRSLASGWYGIPFPSIDAATDYPDGRTYLFYGNRYVRWDYDNMAYLEPQDISRWNGMPFSHIDAAFYWQTNNKVYMFSGSQYLRYDVATDRVDEGYPVDINDYWKGSAMFGSVDAAVAWDNTKVYFFKGNQYLRYDMELDQVDEGYPRTITATNWKGVEFTKIDAVLKWEHPTVYLFSGGRYYRFDMDKNSTY